MIDYTFPADSHASFCGVPLAGLACTKGVPFLERHGSLFVLMVDFQGMSIHAGGKNNALYIPAKATEILFLLASQEVLKDFAVSARHGVGWKESGGFHDPTTSSDYLCAALVGADASCHPCSVGCESAVLTGRLNDFAIVNHPRHGVIGVSLLEFAALRVRDIRTHAFISSNGGLA